jgi:two-component system response regulator RegX3
MTKPDARFALVVSLACHDLRTPLATVSGFAKTLTRLENVGEPAGRYLGMIEAASEQLADLLDDLALAARVRAALRRIPLAEDEVDQPDVVEVGDVRLDAARHEVYVRGAPVALPLKEFELLELLMANAGRVLTRDVLIDRIWGPNYFGDTKTLDVHVKRLRSKIEVDPANPSRIVTVRGVGYRYERAAAAAS